MSPASPTRPGRLTVIRAGAGSGKTYRICEEIADLIVAGLDPARVLATTFTKKAAAELKGRVQARVRAEEKLPYEKRLRLAERLELALIGTVHSVGHRLVRRHALALGLSPALEVIEPEGAKRHLLRLLGELPTAPMEQLLGPARRMEIDEDPHRLVLSLLQTKRTNRIDDDTFRAELRRSGERVSEILLGDAKAPSDAPPGRLAELAKQALDAVRAVPDETKATRGAITKLRRLASHPQGPWSDHLTAARLKAGKRSGADGCLETLRAFALDLRTNAGLHADVHALLEGLADHVVALEAAYADYKAERGLLDFNDLEVLLLRLLEDPALAQGLGEEIDLVVVDEFQDTNPIQLALFLRFREIARQSIWVGDQKQAIYAFRGADAELVDQAWRAVEGADTATLANNYRSAAGLVRIVGELFAPVLGDEAKLDPVRDGETEVLERWILQTKNKTQDAAALTRGIQMLLDEGARAGELAVLTRTNQRALETAEALTEAGIPALVARPGLLGTRECTVARAGLRLVADRYDGVAAATLLHLAEPPDVEVPSWFPRRLLQVREEDAPRPPPFDADPLLAALSDIEPRHADPVATLEAVIEALGLGRRIRRWGRPDVRAANLDAFVDLARAYQDEASQLGQAVTLTAFLVWLADAVDGERDEFPMPAGIDAVSVVTVHKSKGLEWPTVILVDLDKHRDPEMWSPRAEGGHAAEGRPLDGRRLRYWPWPFGRALYGKLRTGSRLEQDALATPEGEDAFRRAEAEELRLLYVALTRARDRLVVAHRPGGGAWPHDHLPSWADLVGKHDEEGTFDLGETGARLRVRHLTPPEEPEADEGADLPADTCRWFAPRETPTATPVPRTATPSGAPPLDDETLSLEAEPLPGEHPLSGGIRTQDHDALGSAVHAYLAALVSLAAADDPRREKVAARCLATQGVEGIVTPKALVTMGRRLEAWVKGRWPDARWHVEVPVRGRRKDGGGWTGFVDLLLVQPDGTAVVVDHKSAPLPEKLWTKKAAGYTGQLAAYQEALKSAGLDVRETWIHLPLGGGAVRVGRAGGSVTRP